MYLYLYFADMISDLCFTFLELFRLLAALGMAKSTTQMWIPALEITYLIVILEQHMRYLFVHGIFQIPQKLYFRSYHNSNICTIFVHTLKFKLVWWSWELLSRQNVQMNNNLQSEDSFLLNLFPICTYWRYFRYFQMCRTMQIELRSHAIFIPLYCDTNLFTSSFIRMYRNWHPVCKPIWSHPMFEMYQNVNLKTTDFIFMMNVWVSYLIITQLFFFRWTLH